MATLWRIRIIRVIKMGPLALVLLIIAAFAIPRLGATLLLLLFICAACVGLLIIAGQNNKSSFTQQPAAITHIAISEVQLRDLQLVPQQYSPSSFRLTGRVQNKNPLSPLTTIRLKVTLQDCVNVPNDCETVGETMENLYVTVPSLQSRDLNESVYFSSFNGFKGTPNWLYSIVDVNGQGAADPFQDIVAGNSPGGTGVHNKVNERP